MTWSASRRSASDVAARGEELEGADPDVARRHARQHGAGQRRLAQDLLAGRDRSQRARGRNAERHHRLADDVLAQHRPERCPAIAAARERRRPRALELDVAPHAGAVDDLAQQDGPAVAELRHEVAELVAGIGERDRFGARRDAVAGQHLDALRTGEPRRVEAELAGQRLVQLEQARRRDGRRREPGIEPLRQAGIAVVEREGVAAGPRRAPKGDGQSAVVRHVVPSRLSSRRSSPW